LLTLYKNANNPSSSSNSQPNKVRNIIQNNESATHALKKKYNQNLGID
jgi:hypothetical protein